MSEPTLNDGRVQLDIDAGLATVIFDRPDARNAMTWPMYEQLVGHLERLRAEPSVRVVRFRGAGGKAFVAGTDITQFAGFSSGEDGVAYERRIDACIALLESLPQPTVAIVDGWCVGGGLAIATACDFRIATPEARFAVPIARTLGNTLSVANLARLVAAFGQSRIKRMLMLAETIASDEALACGYLHSVHPCETLDDAVMALSGQLSALAPVTQATVKEGLRRIVSAGLPDGDDLIRSCYGSEDFHEGVAAFVAKRPPQWKGT